MIRSLQRKFVLIAMGSLLLVIVVIIGCINAYNIYHMNIIAGGIMAQLAEHDGRFPEPESYEPPGSSPGFVYKMTAETRFETRFFTIRAFFDGSDMEVDTGFIAAVSVDEAKQYAQSVLSGSRTTGYMGVYKYLAVEKPYGTLVIFLDRHLQIQTIFSFFWTSFFVAILSLMVMFALVSVLSKRAIKPVVESIEKQKQFITDAGHEIKTPLAIISANTEVLELSHGASEWTKSIRKQTARLDDLVKYLLTLSKMEEEKIHLTFASFSISDLVREEAVSFETLAESQAKHFEQNIQPGLTLHGDEGGMRQVVSILMDNAIKYAGSQGKIKVSLRRQGQLALLEVRNTADPLPEGDLNRLFDRFFRADASRSRESGGYGLGLPIAKAIVQAHKGKIVARRESNSWLCFSVSLTLVAD